MRTFNLITLQSWLLHKMHHHTHLVIIINCTHRWIKREKALCTMLQPSKTLCAEKGQTIGVLDGEAIRSCDPMVSIVLPFFSLQIKHPSSVLDLDFLITPWQLHYCVLSGSIQQQRWPHENLCCTPLCVFKRRPLHKLMTRFLVNFCIQNELKS